MHDYLGSVPYDEMVEVTTLGAMITEPSAIKLFYEKGFTIDIFYADDNKKVARMILDTYMQHGIVEIQLLMDRYKATKSSEHPKTGTDYLFHLVQNTTTKSSVPYYLNILEEKYKLRVLIEKSREVIESAMQPMDSVDDFLFNSEESILSITRTTSSGTMQCSEKVVSDAMERFAQAMANDGTVSGLATGYRDLDKVTNGLQNGDLIILGARPSVGKTAFALNLGLNIASMNKDGKANIAIFSLEMPAVQLMNRLTSTVSKVPNYKIRDGRVNVDELNSVNSAFANLQGLNFNINDDSSITVPDIFKECRNLKNESGIDLIIIDYMQLISSKGGGENRQQEISKISRQLKNLAREMDVPVIALSQLSRKLESREDKTPILSDLRESGSIEQDADIVMFLHRDDYGDVKEGAIMNDDISESLLRIAKNRHGSLKDIQLAFEKNTGKFRDVTYR